MVSEPLSVCRRKQAKSAASQSSQTPGGATAKASLFVQPFLAREDLPVLPLPAQRPRRQEGLGPGDEWRDRSRSAGCRHHDEEDDERAATSVIAVTRENGSIEAGQPPQA